MIDQDQNGDPKQGFGKPLDKKSQSEAGNDSTPKNDDTDKKEVSEKVKERQKAIEDTSSINYGNIGVEGGVEDLDEED